MTRHDKNGRFSLFFVVVVVLLFHLILPLKTGTVKPARPISKTEKGTDRDTSLGKILKYFTHLVDHISQSFSLCSEHWVVCKMCIHRRRGRESATILPCYRLHRDTQATGCDVTLQAIDDTLSTSSTYYTEWWKIPIKWFRNESNKYLLVGHVFARVCRKRLRIWFLTCVQVTKGVCEGERESNKLQWIWRTSIYRLFVNA